MRLSEQTTGGSRTTRFELPRPDGNPVVLNLQPLPLGFHRRLRAKGIVPPAPPTRVARDSAGKPIRDEQGLAVLVADERDADYLSQLEEYQQRVAVLMIMESLAADPGVAFETPEPEEPHDWRKYADALFNELERALWVAGDVLRLCEEIFRLSNLISDHLFESRRNFSPPAAGR